MEPESNNWLENELSTIFAKEIRKEIDNHIMIDLLMSSSAYNYKHIFDSTLTNDINEWCKSNLKDGWKVFQNVILIESDADNNWYLLRWT